MCVYRVPRSTIAKVYNDPTLRPDQDLLYTKSTLMVTYYTSVRDALSAQYKYKLLLPYTLRE